MPGDIVNISDDLRTYTISGQIANGVVKFPKPMVSLLDALSMAGGINSTTGDASSVFVLRNHPIETIYQIKLSKKNGLIIARDFLLSSGDVIYVPEASYSKGVKSISTLLLSINSAGQLATAGDQAKF